MATATLTWTPGGGGGDQLVQYKKHDLPDWTDRPVLGPAVTTDVFTGILPNVLYDFRVTNRCGTGTSNAVNSSSAILTCPVLAGSASSDMINAEVTIGGGSITKYDIVLSLLAGGVISTQTVSAPFSGVGGTPDLFVFTGLTPATAYTLKVVPYINLQSKIDCPVVNVTTAAAPTCTITTGLGAEMG